MLRRLVAWIAHRNDKPIRRIPGERGRDYLHRNLDRHNEYAARRKRRQQGKFPWLGLGKLWRWLYAQYNKDQIDQQSALLDKMSVVDFTREKMRQMAFYRKITPPQPISDDQLDRSVQTNQPKELP